MSALRDLVALATQCGRVARLANDLATYNREVQEGRVNALNLVSSAMQRRSIPEPPAEAAARIVESRLHREMERAHNLSDSIATDSMVNQRFIDVTQFGIEIYSRSDFRDIELRSPGTQADADTGQWPRSANG